MASLNQCNFIGVLTRDPELKMTPSGTPICKFTLAVEETWKNASGDKQKKTHWINCVVMGKRAEVVEKFVRKGHNIFVQAQFDSREYEKDGVKKTFIEFKVNDFSLIGAVERSAGGGQRRNSNGDDAFGAPPAEGTPLGDEDIPF